MPRNPTPLSFLQAIVSQWFSAMSGGLSVPLAAAGYYLASDDAKHGFYLLSLVCVIVACYWAWKKEREKVMDLSYEFPEYAVSISGDVIDKIETGSQHTLLRLSVNNNSDSIVKITPSVCNLSINNGKKDEKNLNAFVLRPNAFMSYSWEFDSVMAKAPEGVVTIEATVFYENSNAKIKRKMYREITIHYHIMNGVMVRSEWRNVKEEEITLQHKS